MLIVVALIAILAAASVPIFIGHVEKSRRATDIANAGGIRTEICNAIVLDEVHINDEDAGVLVVVFSDRTKVKKYVSISACSGKDKPRKIGNGKKVLPGSLNDVIVGYNNGIHCMQRKIDWYAVTVYGDGSSYYWEGKGSVNFRNAKRYEWTELGK